MIPNLECLSCPRSIPFYNKDIYPDQTITNGEAIVTTSNAEMVRHVFSASYALIPTTFNGTLALED